jgi:hypothetical protein
MVDIQAIGLTANGDNFSTQLMEHLGRYGVGSPVCGINHDFQAFERQVVGESTLAKLYIAPGSVVEALSLAQVS